MPKEPTVGRCVLNKPACGARSTKRNGAAPYPGWTPPVPSSQLASLYPSNADYVSKLTAATAAAQQAGFILADDAPLIEEEAQSAPVPH